jgi:hypothetical protein
MSRSIRLEGHVARMGDECVQGFFVREFGGKRRLGRFRRRWEDNIKWLFREIGWGGMD